ncbi:uncharacterized protein TNCV_212261 [Trichonephila clavipes]|nr:uncharacterized protein TNCV_212261 [Trichonephila clavipes]
MVAPHMSGTVVKWVKNFQTGLTNYPRGKPSLINGATTTRGLLATDHVILNHGQVTWWTPELAPPLLTTTPHQREDVSALDRFNVHRCPTRRVFSGTGLEPVTKQATVRYLYHSATAATWLAVHTPTKSSGLQTVTSDQGPRNSLQQGARYFTPVVSCSIVHHAGDSTILLSSTSEEYPGGGQEPSTSLPIPLILQEDLRFEGYSEYPMPQRHYTFANNYAFSRIRTQALRHRSQCHQVLYQMCGR